MKRRRLQRLRFVPLWVALQHRAIFRSERCVRNNDDRFRPFGIFNWHWKLKP